MNTTRIGCPECAWGKVLGCWRCGQVNSLTRRAFIPVGCDQQGRVIPTLSRDECEGMDDMGEYACPMPAEACSEIGADTAPSVRMGLFRSWERWALRNAPTLTVIAAVAAAHFVARN